MTVWLRIAVPLLSFAIAALFGRWLIPFMHKISFGQPIKMDGPSWHANKQGTPIMGGLMFMFGAIVSCLIGYTAYRASSLDITDAQTSIDAWKLIICILYALSFSLIGFADDYTKAVKKQNLGLTAKQKMFFQAIFSSLFLLGMYLTGDKSTSINFIFAELDFGILYYPIMLLFMIYLTNAVNLTDGVDGLCGSVTVVSMLAMTRGAAFLHMHEISFYAMALAGGCLGFLVWNLHPAKCFMGDTGSMFLGASFVAVGMAMHQHLFMVLAGIVYVCEALSVVIQVTYFKITAKMHYKKTGEKGKGKRIFKMSPIHHHFEMSGFSEYKIVICFSAVGAAAGMLALAALRSVL